MEAPVSRRPQETEKSSAKSSATRAVQLHMHARMFLGNGKFKQDFGTAVIFRAVCFISVLSEKFYCTGFVIFKVH